MNSTKVRFAITTLAAGIAAIINYLISLVLTSYISETISTEAYGFVGLAKSISGYTVLFTTCLNAFAARYITLSYHKGDIGKTNTYFTSLFFGNIFISIILLILASILIIHLEHVFAIPQSLIRDVKALFLFDFINYFILAIGTVYSTYAFIKNRLDLVNIIKVLSYLIEALCLYLLYYFLPPRLSYVGVALCVSSLIILTFNKLASNHFLPSIRVRAHYFSVQAIKEFLRSGIWNSLNHLGNILNIGLDLIVANRFLSAIAMGQLAIIKTFSTVFATLFQIVSLPFQPLLLDAYAHNDTRRVVYLFKQSIKLSSLFSNILFASLIAYGLPFLKLWIPTQDLKILYVLLVITIMGHLVEGIAYPLFYTYTLTLKNKLPCYMTIAGGVLNVLSMIILICCFHQGTNAVVLTTTVLAWGMHLIFTPLYTAHCLSIKWYTFYPIIFKVLLSALLCVCVFSYLSKLFNPISWFKLIGVIIFCSFIGIIIHVFVTCNNRKEIYDILHVFSKK